MKKESSQTLLVPAYKIVITDYYSLVAFTIPVVFWTFYIVITLLGYFPNFGRVESLDRSDASFFLFLAIVLTPPTFFFLLLRIRAIRHLLQEGQEIKGEIIHKSFYRRRGRIEYTYHYKGELYYNGNALMQTPAIKYLKEGDKVVLLVDPKNPQRALIRVLYIN
jgi:hypothetical protein